MCVICVFQQQKENTFLYKTVFIKTITHTKKLMIFNEKEGLFVIWWQFA